MELSGIRQCQSWEVGLEDTVTCVNWVQSTSHLLPSSEQLSKATAVTVLVVQVRTPRQGCGNPRPGYAASE